MPRMEIWRGPIALAKRIEAAVRRWDENEEVAKNVLVSPVKGGEEDEAVVVASFATTDDGQDAAGYADGYADGFVDGLDFDEDLEDEDQDEEDLDLEDEDA